MANTLKILLLKSLICGILSAQFQVDLPIKSLPTNINGELEKNHSIFDFNMENFDYNYGLTTNRSRYDKNKHTQYLIPRIDMGKNISYFKMFLKLKTPYEDLKYDK